MPVRRAFQPEIVPISITEITPIKTMPAAYRKTATYRRIAASMAAVGLIEPLIAFPTATGKYILLEGHTRLDILAATSALTVNCLLATDNESYTYNKRVNYIPPIAQREMAIRKALGAGRGHIIRQLLAEGSVLVALGAATGLALDAFLREQLRYVRWPSAYNLPFEFHFQNDRGLFLYALAAALVAMLISSFLPRCARRSRPRHEAGRALVHHSPLEPAQRVRHATTGAVSCAA